MGEIDMVSMALVAAVDTELRASQDAVRDWRPSPYTGPVDVFGLPPATALPATVVKRRHECGTDERLAGGLPKLLG
jgi:hypothetical protein